MIWGPTRGSQRICKVKPGFRRTGRRDLPFPLSFSPKYTDFPEASRSVIAPQAEGRGRTYHCFSDEPVNTYLNIFSALILNVVNTDRCNPFKLKPFGVLNNVSECHGVQRPKTLRTPDLSHWEKRCNSLAFVLEIYLRWIVLWALWRVYIFI